MNKRLIPLLLLLIIKLTACQVGPSTGKELTAADWYVPDQTLTVWALSDTHIKDEAHIKPFRNAVRDMNDNVPDVDMAINAGDVVHFPTEESYDLYIKTRDGSYITEWHEIIGNHDYKTDKGNIFREKLRGGGDVNYTVEKGNILFIFMSNEDRGKPTVISDETFEWWKDLVVKNQDKIIVVTTHAPLDGSGITFSGLKPRQIVDSKRFREVLKQYKVDVWLSGHLHIPQELFGTIVKQKKLNGTVFIEISSIRPDLGGIKEPESRVLTFACGSDKMLVRSRNHERRFYTPGLDKVFTLSKAYECE
jgi:3',5'-cyclic AMP phosphodiesterase CpdA